MLCLEVATDPAWATAAIGDLDRVVVDHAHCEMKAASNALSLIARHPGSLALVRALTELAREELDHFERVTTILDRRGLSLGPPPVDDYAAELRRASAKLPRDATLPPLADRLLVGALIEARSCERFQLLTEALDRMGGQEELAALYRELFACEAKHYRTYVDLAKLAAPDASPKRIEERLLALAHVEGRIVSALAQQATRATVHG